MALSGRALYGRPVAALGFVEREGPTPSGVGGMSEAKGLPERALPEKGIACHFAVEANTLETSLINIVAGIKIRDKFNM